MLDLFDPVEEVRPLTDYFERGTKDADWLSGLGEWAAKPAVIGGDGRILRNKAELAQLKGAGLTFVLLAKGWANTKWEAYGWKIIKAWPEIRNNVLKIRVPTVFEVSAGSLKVTSRGPLANF